MRIPENIVTLIKQNYSEINHIDLSYFGLDDDDIAILGDLFKVNKNITSLNLRGNNIGAEGAKTLATLSLLALDIRDNAIGDEGAIWLLSSKTLEMLQTSGNGVSEAAFRLSTQMNEGKTSSEVNLVPIIVDREKLASLCAILTAMEELNKTNETYQEKYFAFFNKNKNKDNPSSNFTPSKKSLRGGVNDIKNS